MVGKPKVIRLNINVVWKIWYYYQSNFRMIQECAAQFGQFTRCVDVMLEYNRAERHC